MWMKFAALFMCALMAVIVFPPAHFLGGSVVSAQQYTCRCIFPNEPNIVGVATANGFCSFDGATPCFSDTDCCSLASSTLPDSPPPAAAKTTAKPPVSDLSKLAATTTAAAVVSAFAFTLPGTTQVGDWSDPRTKTPPPPAGNPYLCDKPGNYTLDAQLDSENAFAVDVQPLFQSGDQITVFGDVSAKSSTCRGMTLTCSEQKAQACKVDKKLLGYELKYEDCRNGFIQVYATGARKERSIVAIVLLVVAVVLSVISIVGAPAMLGLKAAAATKLAGVGAIASSTGSTIASQNMANSIDDKPCFNVCGKAYESKDPSDPLCYKGGPVIDFKNVQYQCKEASCGPAKQKTVNIDIKTETGSKVASASTKTDAEGHFSYTFTAPSSDGNYLVFVKVPKA